MSLDFDLTHKCPCCGNTTGEYFNITHNLGPMAREAGIYQVLWRPEEVGYTTGGEIIGALERGLEKLKANPKYFETFNAKNGWGLYEHFVPWVEKVLNACRAHPDWKISVSR